LLKKLMRMDDGGAGGAGGAGAAGAAGAAALGNFPMRGEETPADGGMSDPYNNDMSMPMADTPGMPSQQEQISMATGIPIEGGAEGGMMGLTLEGMQESLVPLLDAYNAAQEAMAQFFAGGDQGGEGSAAAADVPSSIDLNLRLIEGKFDLAGDSEEKLNNALTGMIAMKADLARAKGSAVDPN
jgi:hypothetical protein